MQSVNSAFTAEEKDSVRKIADSLQVSWHKQSLLANRTFTIAVSTIGGNDGIGINPGSIGSPGIYKYFDESSYVKSLAWERSLNMPVGGIAKALAEARLDNTSGRFTPRYMGGNSELFTAQPLRAPLIINAGFNFGVDQTIPQFTGLINKQPIIDIRNREVSIEAADYIDFFQGKYLEQQAISTGQRTDQIMASLLQSQLGMNTAQYDLDNGINIIPFAFFDVGMKMSDIFQQLAEAEAGHFYQDESGIFKFRNRQWGDSSPFNSVQKIISTSQVISSIAPNDDHLINVVEVKGSPREKQSNQLVWQSTSFAGSGTFAVNPSSSKELFINFDDPVLAIDKPVPNGTIGQTSFYIANTIDDGSGLDATSSLIVSSIYKFAQSTKITFTNTSSAIIYLVSLDLWGRPARRTGDLYVRTSYGHSITAFQEQLLTIDNEFIQSNDWANSLGQMIINDFGIPENLQTIIVRAIPELQLFDLISWQGRYWRVFDIKSTLEPGTGFIQELTLLQRNIVTYFKIGISSIGSSDKIAP